MPKKEETSSDKSASLAAKVLSKGKATTKEALSLAGSVLTNAPNKPAAKGGSKGGGGKKK